jgi:hypothetical protein
VDDSISRLTAIEKKIVDSDNDGLRARWESGKELLTVRGIRKYLPRGYAEQAMQALSVSRSELTKRLKFAELYPTDSECDNAVTTFGSWHEVVKSGLKDPNKPPVQRKPKQVASPSHEDSFDYLFSRAGSKRAELYKAIARVLHPDLNPDTADLFAELTDAYNFNKE